MIDQPSEVEDVEKFYDYICNDADITVPITDDTLHLFKGSVVDIEVTEQTNYNGISFDFRAIDENKQDIDLSIVIDDLEDSMCDLSTEAHGRMADYLTARELIVILIGEFPSEKVLQCLENKEITLKFIKENQETFFSNYYTTYINNYRDYEKDVCITLYEDSIST